MIFDGTVGIIVGGAAPQLRSGEPVSLAFDGREYPGLAVEPAPAAADAEVATVAEIATEGGRKILESAQVGDVRVEWRRGSRQVPAGYQMVRTNQPLAAIAVYLCEPESDDGAVENGLVAAPAVGDEFPIWRAWP